MVGFRIMHDKESGKSKGYGFCEYHDKETAQVAMKNLNNVNFNGRQLRVGEASGGMGKESSKGEHRLFFGNFLSTQSLAFIALGTSKYQFIF